MGAVVSLDWAAIVTGVLTELIVAGLLGLIGLGWMFGKRVARCLVSRAAATRHGTNSELAEEWKGNIEVCSRTFALRFAFSIWWHRNTIHRTINRGDDEHYTDVSVNALRFLHTVGGRRAAGAVIWQILCSRSLLILYARARGRRAREMVMAEALERAAGRWLVSAQAPK